jgi:urease accessory protein
MWTGHLQLQFERVGARTVIARRRHSGPLLVQRAFHEPDGGCQVYLIHPPGGVVAGDQLALELELQAASRALVTTPAATKLYSSSGAFSQLTQQFTVAQDAILEFLPQETILYDGARARSSTCVTLAPRSQFVGWEISCLGRDERGFSSGSFVQHWQLERAGRLLWSERSLLEGGSPLLQASWGLGGRRVLATLVGTGAADLALEPLREQAQQLGPADDCFSVTRLGEVLVCRYLGYSSEAAKRFFCAAWAFLRQAVSGRGTVPPRIWAT